MRNASLIALKKVNHNEAEAIAKKLLSDKALVVRSAAVEVMADNLNEENKKALMAELNQSYNFHKKNSLWIRKQIANHLMLVAQDSDRDFFVKNLFDHDRTIAEICAAALEKITGINIGGADSVEKWKKTVATKKWLAD